MMPRTIPRGKEIIKVPAAITIVIVRPANSNCRSDVVNERYA
jgi:hypothetical protein